MYRIDFYGYSKAIGDIYPVIVRGGLKNRPELGDIVYLEGKQFLVRWQGNSIMATCCDFVSEEMFLVLNTERNREKICKFERRKFIVRDNEKDGATYLEELV